MCSGKMNQEDSLMLACVTYANGRENFGALDKRKYSKTIVTNIFRYKQRKLLDSTKFHVQQKVSEYFENMITKFGAFGRSHFLSLSLWRSIFGIRKFTSLSFFLENQFFTRAEHIKSRDFNFRLLFSVTSNDHWELDE